MKAKDKNTPTKYWQPTRGYIRRNLDGNVEEVDYVPESHMRIWYNNQLEGYELHWHNALEVIICTENHYTAVANGKTYDLNVGDILFIPPHMAHELICNSRGIRFICLFNIDILNIFNDYKGMTPIFMEAYLCNAASCPEIYAEVYSAFMNAIDIYFENHILWETRIYSLLIKIISCIASNYVNISSKDTLASEDQKSREYYDKISYLLNYIDSNYAEEISLEQAAAYIGFSKYHFTRLFKQYTNSTFYEYLCHKRIQAAQHMLSTYAPITNIAFQTGFNNMTTFCRCFRKITNCTPTEYRNKFRKEHIH